jgi:hypothetical protein
MRPAILSEEKNGWPYYTPNRLIERHSFWDIESAVGQDFLK